LKWKKAYSCSKANKLYNTVLTIDVNVYFNIVNYLILIINAVNYLNSLKYSFKISTTL